MDMTEPERVTRTFAVRRSVVWSVAIPILVGCGEDPTEAPAPAPVARVSVSPSRLTITADQQAQLRALAVDADGTTLHSEIAWSSADTAVATVDATGLVTGVGAGSTEITATSEERSDGASIVVSEPGGFVQIALWDSHTCGIATDGGTYCWGRPSAGRLGVGPPGEIQEDPQLGPAPVYGDREFVLVTAGLLHSCALNESGTAWCWGANYFGNLGNGNEEDRNVPGSVSAEPLASLVSGDHHNCGLRSADGGAECWGSNLQGQVGNGGDPLNVLTPVHVTGDLTFSSLAAGGAHTCGVGEEGASHCWGWNGYGQLGIGDTEGVGDHRPTPQEVVGGPSFLSLALGGEHSCGAGGDGAAYCWGSDGSGQLGSGGTTAGRCRDAQDVESPCSLSPQEVVGGLSFEMLAGGGWHTCGIVEGGAVYCWGLNDRGQLGIGDRSEPVLEPRRIVSELTFASLEAGFGHTCGITTDDVAYCWGRNDYGQLGDGTLVDRPEPVRVLGQN